MAIEKQRRDYGVNSLHSDPQISALIQQIQVIGQAIAKALEPVAEAFFQIAPKLMHEFSKYDYAKDALSKAGWVPHYTTPFEHIATWSSDPETVQSELLGYYTSNWDKVRLTIESRLWSYDIDPESKATFAEALDAHEAGFYRCVTRVFFPEIERLLRIEMNITGHLGSKRMIQRLVQRKSDLTQEASLEDFAPSGFYELALFDRMVQVLRSGEQVTDSMLFAGLYDSTERSEDSLERVRRDHVPNRNAAIHGLVVYSSRQNSLNMIFVADYVFQVVDSLKRKAKRDGPLKR